MALSSRHFYTQIQGTVSMKRGHAINTHKVEENFDELNDHDSTNRVIY